MDTAKADAHTLRWMDQADRCRTFGTAAEFAACKTQLVERVGRRMELDKVSKDRR